MEQSLSNQPLRQRATNVILFATITLTLVLSALWGIYYFAADYGYGAVSGVYEAQSAASTSVLHLYADRTFVQETLYNDRRAQVRGTWRRIGAGRIVFSKEFARLDSEDSRSDGQVDGEVKKRWLFFMSINIDPDPEGRVFHKRFF